MSAAASGARQVPCPRCRQPALFEQSNRFRPFCSERCRSLDFGAWASEAYTVATPLAADDEGLVSPAVADAGGAPLSRSTSKA
jgi:uncharacterized protein